MNLLRTDISEPARYYDGERTIVVRKGLLICEERRHLWHELVHADRRDRGGHADVRVEASVEREAARRAMPLVSLEWAAGNGSNVHDMAELLKLPETWVRFRLAIAHPAEAALIRRSTAWAAP